MMDIFERKAATKQNSSRAKVYLYSTVALVPLARSHFSPVIFFVFILFQSEQFPVSKQVCM